MKSKPILLTVALAVIMSALTSPAAPPQPVTVQAAKATNTPISYLPFSITKPGTYVLTGNLNSPLTDYGSGAINISTPVPGPVILDLKGFTINGNANNTTGVSVGWNATSGNTFPITIRNGTLRNFGFGIITFNSHLSDITINNIVFDANPAIAGSGVCGIKWDPVNSSVNNCTFTGYMGIQDLSVRGGGNNFNNDSFINTKIGLWIQGGSVLDHCQFAAPPSN